MPKQIRQHGTHTFRDVQGGAPLLLQNANTDSPVGVDVGVVYLRGEADFGRLERVVCREID